MNVGVVVRDIANSAVGLGFDSRDRSNWTQCCQRLTSATIGSATPYTLRRTIASTGIQKMIFLKSVLQKSNACMMTSQTRSFKGYLINTHIKHSISKLKYFIKKKLNNNPEQGSSRTSSHNQ